MATALINLPMMVRRALELISYAYPNKGDCLSKARRINCPETMRTFKVKELRPVASGETNVIA